MAISSSAEKIQCSYAPEGQMLPVFRQKGKPRGLATRRITGLG